MIDIINLQEVAAKTNTMYNRWNPVTTVAV